MADKDYYKTLGLERDASRADIKRAYRTLAKQFHPDINSRPGAAKQFGEIREAYDVLIDTESRREYNSLITSDFVSSQSGKPPSDQNVVTQGMQGVHGIPPAISAEEWWGRQSRSPSSDPALDMWPQALSSDDWRVRHSAATALGQLEEEWAVDMLIKVLSDDDHLVREAAARALGPMGDKRAVEPLIKALEDDSEWVRFPAAKSLGQLIDKQAVDPLITVLSDDDYLVREAATNALGKLGDKRAIDPLIKVLGDTNYCIRQAAKAALKKLGYEE